MIPATQFRANVCLLLGGRSNPKQGLRTINSGRPRGGVANRTRFATIGAITKPGASRQKEKHVKPSGKRGFETVKAQFAPAETAITQLH